MIKLESTKMQKAIAKAKQMHPRVRMTAERTYSVTGSKGALYTVHFALAKDAQGQTVRLGECSCPAGRQEMMCYHIAAAAAVNIAIQSMRKAAAQKAAPAAAYTGSYTDPYGLEKCVTCGVHIKPEQTRYSGYQRYCGAACAGELAAPTPAATAPAPVAQPRPARSFIVIYSATVDACALGSSLQPGSASVLRVRPVTSLVAS